MNILEKLLGEAYPKLRSAVCADGNRTIVIEFELDAVTEEQPIKVTVEVDGKFNSIDDLRHLAFIAKRIGQIAEDRLSEPSAVKNIGLDCKPFICTDNEPEEVKHEDA